jgi:hypothetical protein
MVFTLRLLFSHSFQLAIAIASFQSFHAKVSVVTVLIQLSGNEITQTMISSVSTFSPFGMRFRLLSGIGGDVNSVEIDHPMAEEILGTAFCVN